MHLVYQPHFGYFRMKTYNYRNSTVQEDWLLCGFSGPGLQKTARTVNEAEMRPMRSCLNAASATGSPHSNGQRSSH
jgi:hypothetical protein